MLPAPPQHLKRRQEAQRANRMRYKSDHGGSSNMLLSVGKNPEGILDLLSALRCDIVAKG